MKKIILLICSINFLFIFSSFSQDSLIGKQLKKEPDYIVETKVSQSHIKQYYPKLRESVDDVESAPNFVNGERFGIKFFVVNPSSVLYRIGFRSGDIWLGLNGAEANRKSFSKMVKIIRKNEEKTEIIVLRSGQYLKIALYLTK